MNLPANALVLVADGRKLLFFRNHGDAGHIDLRVEQHRDQDPRARDQGGDAPGRRSASSGTNRSAKSETDPHQLEEDHFAAEAADELRRRALVHDFDALAVIAPPKTLGELRKHYHKEVERRIVLEIHKDLTGHPVADIEAALTKAD